MGGGLEEDFFSRMRFNSFTLTKNLVISPSSCNPGTKWRWGVQDDDRQFSSSIYSCHRGKYSCQGFS